MTACSPRETMIVGAVQALAVGAARTPALQPVDLLVFDHAAPAHGQEVPIDVKKLRQPHIFVVQRPVGADRPFRQGLAPWRSRSWPPRRRPQL